MLLALNVVTFGVCVALLTVLRGGPDWVVRLVGGGLLLLSLGTAAWLSRSQPNAP